jgi:uroporphyrinogen-III synthase
MTPPLAGLGVLLTRPAAQAGPLIERLETAGARVHCLPVLSLSAFDGPGLQAALSEYSQAALAIFVSANAVQFGLAALAARDIAFASGPQTAAVGQATARALQDAGAADVMCAGAGSDSEALLALPALQTVAGKTVILFRGESEGGGRTLLRDTLLARGARVLEATCYQREPAVPPAATLERVRNALRVGEIQAVQVMSGESLAALIKLVPIEALRGCTLIVPHPRIAATAKTQGLERIQVTGFGEDAFIAALQSMSPTRP